MGGASCKGCVERLATRPVGRGAVQQMGKPLRRPLGVSNRPVEGEEGMEGAMTMTMVRERGKEEAVEVLDQQAVMEEEEAAAEAVQEEEEVVEAEEVPLGVDQANPQMMDRIPTRNRT